MVSQRHQFLFRFLFRNHHNFRLLTVENLKEILDLTAEIDYEARLPPPVVAANELKRLALKSIKEWVQMFGTTYNMLNLCYDFLKRKKKVRFDYSILIDMNNEIFKLLLFYRLILIN